MVEIPKTDTYIKVIYIKLLKKEGDRTPPGHLLSPNRAFSTRIGLHIIVWLAKGVTWKTPNNPG